MTRMLEHSVFAFGLLAILSVQSAFGDNRVYIKQKQFKPTYKECAKALENGVLIPTEGSSIKVFYKDKTYIIATGAAFVCVGLLQEK